MKEFWNAVQFVFTAVGGWLGYFLGGCDGLLFALLAFVAVSYTHLDVYKRQSVTWSFMWHRCLAVSAR